MKNGKKLVLHAVTVIAIFTFGFLALGSSSSPKPVAASTVTGEETIVVSETKSKGTVYHIPSPERKAYTTLGLVFATSTTKYDDKSREISSQEGIATMLLREAQKLGADDILNLRVDENTTWIAHTSTDSTGKEVSVMTKIITYTGSALAIKYNDNAIKDPQLGALPR
jgi:uncharacterized protein YbjQ (UPF0145 family)